VDDGVGAAEDRFEVVARDVGRPKLHAGLGTLRRPAGDTDDRRDVGIRAQRLHEAGADVPGRTYDDDAHRWTSPRPTSF
jgi:hypothetical protein